MRYILPYGGRTPAKIGTVSAYYDEDIARLEDLLQKAASEQPITPHLLDLVRDGVFFAQEQSNKINALQRANNALKRENARLQKALEDHSADSRLLRLRSTSRFRRFRRAILNKPPHDKG